MFIFWVHSIVSVSVSVSLSITLLVKKRGKNSWMNDGRGKKWMRMMMMIIRMKEKKKKKIKYFQSNIWWAWVWWAHKSLELVHCIALHCIGNDISYVFCFCFLESFFSVLSLSWWTSEHQIRSTTHHYHSNFDMKAFPGSKPALMLYVD